MQELISKVIPLRSADHGHFIDAQETDYKRNIKAIYFAPINTCNAEAIIRVWAVLWFLNNMTMVKIAFTQMLHVRKWPLTKQSERSFSPASAFNGCLNQCAHCLSFLSSALYEYTEI